MLKKHFPNKPREGFIVLKVVSALKNDYSLLNFDYNENNSFIIYIDSYRVFRFWKCNGTKMLHVRFVRKKLKSLAR